MNDLDASRAWTAFRSPLRAFIARRVPTGVDVDDVVQDVFLRAHRSVGQLRSADSLLPWLFQIARNALTDALRHRQSKDRLALALLREGEEEGDGVGGGDEHARRALLCCVQPMVAGLDAPYREALELVDLQGLTHAEAAGRVGISVSGMKSRVQRARKQLRAVIEACCAVELDVRNAVVDVGPSCSNCP